MGNRFFPENLYIRLIDIITYQKWRVANKKFEKVNNLPIFILNGKIVISMYYFTPLQNQVSSVLAKDLF